MAIKAKNNGKLPEGYKGAREIAYEKCVIYLVVITNTKIKEIEEKEKQ